MFGNLSVSMLFLVLYLIGIGPLSSTGFGQGPGHLSLYSKALSSWCTDENSDGQKFVGPGCCDNEYRCDWYVNPGGTKDGLMNSGTTRRRTCDCDKKFFDCNTEYLDRIDKGLIQLLVSKEICSIKNKTTGTYKWVDSSSWLHEFDRYAEPPVISRVIDPKAENIDFNNF